MIYFNKHFDHTYCIFRECRLLKLQNVINLHTNLIVHKSIYSFPVYFIAITQNVNGGGEGGGGEGGGGGGGGGVEGEEKGEGKEERE